MTILYSKTGRKISPAAGIWLAVSGLMPLLWAMTIPLSSALLANDLNGWQNGIFNWVMVPFTPKFILIFGYVYSVAVSLAVIGAALYLTRKDFVQKIESRISSLLWMRPILILVALWWLLDIAIFGMLISQRRNIAYLLLALIFLTVICAIAYRYFDQLRVARCRHLIGIVPLLIGVAPLVYIFLVTPFRVPNEFFSLPEQTIMSDGTHVDNFEFINKHKLDNLHIIDPRQISDVTPPLTLAIVNASNEVKSLLADYQKNDPNLFWFDAKNAKFEIHGKLPWHVYRILSLVVSANDLERLNARYKDDVLSANAVELRKYSDTEKEFVKANYAEFGRQLVLGRFFYHHAFLYQAAVARMNGDPDNYSQYGRGFTEFLAATISLFPNELRFNGYLALLYLSYPLYLVFVVWFAQRIRLTRWSTIFVSAVTIFSFIASDMETVRLGVGLAPWRHMFDLAALYALWRYATHPTAWRAALLAAILTATLFWSKEMGVFLALGILFGIGAQFFVTRRQIDIKAFVICLAASVVGFWLGSVDGPDSPYALLGTNTPDLPSGFVEILAIFVLIGFGVWIFLRGRNRTDLTSDPDWVLLGGAFSYSALCGIYLLWYPRIHHLVPVLPIIGLGMAVAYRHLAVEFKISLPRLGAVAVASILLILSGTTVLRGWEIYKENRIFRMHVVEKWKMPFGTIKSTAQPELIQEAIGLVDKYNPGPAIKIISPWEIVILPFAGKYKAGPFPVYFDSLFSSTEINLVANRFLDSPGDILFVDSRLMRGQYEPNIPSVGLLDKYAIAAGQRLGAHATLRTLFEKVRPCFDLVEQGRLISVYRKKSPLINTDCIRPVGPAVSK